MASENIRLAESIKDDILSCPICFEIFTDPRTLPCLHTYCKSCLHKLVEIRFKKARYIRCPECRAEIKLTKCGVEDLKSSFFIHSLMDIYNTKRQVVECTVCKQRKETRDAVSKCTTCGDGLCRQCSSGHLQSTMTAHHIIVPLRDFASGIHDSSLRETQNFPCEEHRKEYEYYCNSCEAVACMSCLVLEHKDHDYTSIKGAFSTKKEVLETMFKDLVSKVHDIEEAKAQVQELKDEASKKSCEINLTITDTGQVVLDAVRREITETKENAEKVIKPRLSRLQNMFEDMGGKIKQGKSAIEFCQSILANGKPVEVLQLESLLRTRLRQLTEETSRVNIEEIGFNTRIEDIYINEKFRGDISLGIFQPDTKLTSVPVSETGTQTEITWNEILKNGNITSTESACGCQIQGQSRDQKAETCDQRVQVMFSASQASGEGSSSKCTNVYDSSLKRESRRSELERGEPAETVPDQDFRGSPSKGDNCVTNPAGDMMNENFDLLNSEPTDSFIYSYVIIQVVLLLLALGVMVMSPSIGRYLDNIKTTLEMSWNDFTAAF